MFKAYGKDRQTVSSCSSKAMMLSAVSCNTDEWREGNRGRRNGSIGWREQQEEEWERKSADRKRKRGWKRDKQ